METIKITSAIDKWIKQREEAAEMARQQGLLKTSEISNPPQETQTRPGFKDRVDLKSSTSY